ncbi:MAG: hypothetical protein E7037_08240 [Verrucomicrobia bacterium]|nr:hypothetical protein [Verrucomicrobiota bacterium]
MLASANIRYETQEVRKEDGTVGRLTSVSQSSMPDFPFDALERFQRINPKVVDVFLSEFQKTAENQRRITDREMGRESALKLAGLLCGVIIILCMLVVCGYCLHLGHTKTAVLFGSSVCVPVVIPLLQLVFNKKTDVQSGRSRLEHNTRTEKSPKEIEN